VLRRLFAQIRQRLGAGMTWYGDIKLALVCGCVECANCRSTPTPLPGCTKHTEPCTCKRISKGQIRRQAIGIKKSPASPYTKEFGMWLQRNFDRLLADPEVFKR
jgi:hypothetical protein